LRFCLAAFNHFAAQPDALVTDINGRSGDQFIDFGLTFSAKGADNIRIFFFFMGMEASLSVKNNEQISSHDKV
jgi:hypothetical protein